MKLYWENGCRALGLGEKHYGEGLNMDVRREVGALILLQAPMG